jgi:hypothetical protein
MLLDPDCKKPKLSLRMLMKYWTSSSYRTGTPVSRKWDEDFFAAAAFIGSYSPPRRLLGNENVCSTRRRGGSIYLSRGGSIYLSAIAKGLIGEKYIELTPGASDNPIKPGGAIRDTQPAMDLEALIGKYIQGNLAKPDDKGQPPR